MRLFFGLDLDPGAKAAIADWRDRYTVADGPAVAPANFHITLAFLGELEEGLLERLCDSVDAWHAGTQAQVLALTLDRVGYWPSPGIYWLGPGKDVVALAGLARKLGSIGQAYGGRRERKNFVPHVTLYRRCDGPPPAPVCEPRIGLEFQEFVLFESKATRNGVAYTPIAAWPLC